MKRHYPMLVGTSHERKGAILVLIAVFLPLMLMMSVFAINIAWMHLTRTQLRTATDAAAKAGNWVLMNEEDADGAFAAAREAAGLNNVGGKGLLLADEDIQLGKSEPAEDGTYRFEELPEDSDDLTAVRVTGRRTADSPSGSIELLFPGVFSRNTFSPVRSATAAHVRVSGHEIALVLDRSGSMENDDRWENMLLAVNAFLETMNSTSREEKIALVTFAEEATTDHHLTDQYSGIQHALAAQEPDGGTGTGRGIRAGVDALTGPESSTSVGRTIVVMTDGKHNKGIEPTIAASEAWEDHSITVHTVTFGDDVEDSEMEEVAREGGGHHWHSENAADLASAFLEASGSGAATFLIE